MLSSREPLSSRQPARFLDFARNDGTCCNLLSPTTLFALVALGLLLGQALHLLFINLDLPGFFHLLAQVRHEQPEQFGLLGLHQRIADLIFLGGEVRVR